MDGAIPLPQWLNVAFTDDEAWKFVANPWQVFENRHIYIPTISASSTPTLLTASAINITNTVARARITFSR
jgi:hypothetical protein